MEGGHSRASHDHHTTCHTRPLDNLPRPAAPRARKTVSRENTREQPDHCSSTRENRNTGLPHAHLQRETLTSFARTPHDQLRTLPTQVAWGTSLLCLSRPTVQDGMSTQIDNDLWSWYPCRSTVHYMWKFPWVTDPYRRHSWESVTRGISASDG